MFLKGRTNINSLPSFFVVGAQKAGTTSLHDWLRQQPEVRLPVLKETHFFSHEQRYGRGIEWYMRQFPPAKDGCITGEIDPQYMYYGAAAQRIKETAGSPKLVFIFRNPIDRAYSNYQMSLGRGFEDLTFIAALEAEAGRLSARDNEFAKDNQGYMARGMYAKQVRRYLALFPSSRLMFIKFDDMVSRETGEGIYGEICRFIGVRSSPGLADRSKTSNQASTPRSEFVRDLLYRPRRTLVRKAVGFMLSELTKSRIFMMLEGLNRAPAGNDLKKDIGDIPGHIRDGVIKDLLETEKLTGLKFDGWIKKIGSNMRQSGL